MVKKTLVTSTAIATIAAMSYSTLSEAAEWEISLGGYMEAAGFYASDDRSAAGFRNSGITNEAEFHIQTELVADNGIKFGARIELEANIDDDANKGDQQSDETFLYVEGSFGKIYLGSTEAVTGDRRIGLYDTGALHSYADQDYFNYTNTDTRFLVRPRHYVDRNIDDRESAAKINYFTPRFSGFQAGFSYTPDTGDEGTAAALSTNNNSGQFENVFDGLISFGSQSIELDNGLVIRMDADGSFQVGTAEDSTEEDLFSYGVGGSITLDNGLTIGGSYINHGDSGEAISANRDDGTVTSAFVKQDFDNGFGLASSILFSENPAGDEYQDIEIGVTYNLAEGLTLGASYHIFEADEAAGTTLDNEGTAGLAYLQMNF